MYNILLYIGLFLMAFGFILFIISEMEDRRIDRELFRQQQLTKSFERNKNEMLEQSMDNTNRLLKIVDKLEQRIATLEKVLQSHAKCIGEMREKKHE